MLPVLQYASRPFTYSALHCLGHTHHREFVLSLMGIVSSKYQYMDDLLDLEQSQPILPVIQWPRGPSPISIPALSTYLLQHTDQMYANYIYNGLCHGFHIGFNRLCSLKQNWHNHLSSLDNPPFIVVECLDDFLLLGARGTSEANNAAFLAKEFFSYTGIPFT